MFRFYILYMYFSETLLEKNVVFKEIKSRGKFDVEVHGNELAFIIHLFYKWKYNIITCTFGIALLSSVIENRHIE